MTVVAGADNHGKGVTGCHLSFHHCVYVITGAGQMAIDAVDAALAVTMCRVGGIPDLIAVTAGAEGVGALKRACFLGMYLVTVGARHTGPSVVA